MYACAYVHARARAHTHTHTIKFIQQSLDEDAQFRGLRSAHQRTTFHSCRTWSSQPWGMKQYILLHGRTGTDTDTDGQTKLTVAFRNFANAPKKTNCTVLPGTHAASRTAPSKYINAKLCKFQAIVLRRENYVWQWE